MEDHRVSISNVEGDTVMCAANIGKMEALITDGNAQHFPFRFQPGMQLFWMSNAIQATQTQGLFVMA